MEMVGGDDDITAHQSAPSVIAAPAYARKIVTICDKRRVVSEAVIGRVGKAIDDAIAQ
ncbi:hypothetical protein GCM10007047_23830 [Cerasicoccus arenae]|uniref:Uncharacterized protein n=1 Tax=Cerasicoccus arenae TaxID=424488 RepID=A0A8J3GET7_9BACT|nr:hypothetical protein GCM10007047_23830 [Cerasicoccus arenae]